MATPFKKLLPVSQRVPFIFHVDYLLRTSSVFYMCFPLIWACGNGWVLCSAVKHFKRDAEINISVEKHRWRRNQPRNGDRAQWQRPQTPTPFLSLLSLLLPCTENDGVPLSRYQLLKVDHLAILPTDQLADGVTESWDLTGSSLNWHSVTLKNIKSVSDFLQRWNS